MLVCPNKEQVQGTVTTHRTPRQDSRRTTLDHRTGDRRCRLPLPLYYLVHNREFRKRLFFFPSVVSGLESETDTTGGKSVRIIIGFINIAITFSNMIKGK